MMKAKIFKNVNYIGWIIIVATFLFMYFSYFFIFIPKKEAQVQQKGFRILKEYGSNMLDKHKYFETHFKNYGLYYSIKFLVDENKIVKKVPYDTVQGRKISHVIENLLPYVLTIESKDSSNFSERRKGFFLSFNNRNSTGNLVTSLEKIYNRSDNDSVAPILRRDFTYKVPINSFMENLKFDELFENILLLDKVDVKFNYKYGTLTDITNPAALCDTVDKRQGGVYKILTIRGEEKHTLILPIDFAGKRYYVAGFISNNDYRNKTHTINKQWLMFIAIFLLLVFAGMPILKIFFIDERERLKASDASGSAISLLFGISLLILLIIAFSKKQLVDTVTQKQRIEMISDTLVSNIKKDIESIKTLGDSIANGINLKDATLAKKVANSFSNSGVSFVRDTGLSSPFPLNEIILINKNGIFTKGYTRTPFSDIVKVNLSERQYFNNIIDISKSWTTPGGLNFYIESIKSFNTGFVETAISFHNSKIDSLPVLAITSKIPSLYHQVLPKDIQFVVINKTGNTLYHSTQDKSLHENFIFECESNLSLIEAVKNGSNANIRINYNEKNWLARVVPISDTPLYHVTLLDLNQADNRNARVFLFSFYFIIATLVLILIGFLITRWIAIAQKNKNHHIWFLNWIVLQPREYPLYKILTLVILIIIAIQFFVLFIDLHPIEVFLYQFIFVVYTLFVSMVLLDRRQERTKMPFYKEYFNELGIFLATLLLIVFFVSNFDLELVLILPLVIYISITVFIFFFMKNEKSKKLMENMPKNISSLKLRTAYLAFLFFWLASISVVPVIVFYFSIKKQEQKLWEHEQLNSVALANIDLLSAFEDHTSDWFKRIQGNGVDFLEVSNISDSTIFVADIEEHVDSSFASKVYDLLPDPISNWYNQPKIETQKNYVSSSFVNHILLYRKGHETGAIGVKYSNQKRFFKNCNYVGLLFILLLVISVSLWYLLKYLASVLLNLEQEKSADKEKLWFDILKNINKTRILLKTFDGQAFFEKSEEIAKTHHNIIKEIRLIRAVDMIAPDFKTDSFPTDPNSIIWINGLRNIILEFDSHEKFLSIFNKLSGTIAASIIVDLSFEIGLIHEFYDDYIATCDLKPEQEAQIFVLRKKWDNLFEAYSIYNGYLNQDIENAKNLREEDSFRKHSAGLNVQYSHIWANLTSFEKILLYDLADDGLINRKNKEMLHKLINKRLIITDPSLAFYSNGFSDFVGRSMKYTDVKTIERKLGLKGSWHNAKYLILLIIMPLAAFVVITQGISIEKAFGIFAGGLAILTGIIRLFDSNTFKS